MGRKPPQCWGAGPEHWGRRKWRSQGSDLARQGRSIRGANRRKGEGNLSGGSTNRLNRLDRSTSGGSTNRLNQLDRSTSKVRQYGRLVLLCGSHVFIVCVNLHVPYVIYVFPCSRVGGGSVLGPIQLLLSDLELLLQTTGVGQYVPAFLGRRGGGVVREGGRE